MVIQRLPSAVVSSLRTDVTVTTISQCVVELVLNAIDAGSTSVAVRIDLRNFRIQVIDNGCGLSFSDLNLIGTRYMTSKCHSIHDLQGNLKYYGFRGEAMSSISDVCGTMSIVSRCKDTEDTFCKVFSEGVALKVGKSRHQRASWGSTITVADFLYNRPVRRARIKPAVDLEDVKTSLEAVALINPRVSFSLRNDVNNDMIMQTQRVNEIPSVFRTLYGNSIAKSLVPVKESMGPFCIEGYISNEAHLLKNLQFIYVNKRLLLKTKIHKLVNSIMSRSAILKSNNVPHAPISKEINHNVFLAFSPPKRDKHAIFVLNITCPLSEYDITLDPKKTLVEFCNWDCLLSCFERLLRKFIESHAGPIKGEEGGFSFDPPRKVETVIDEINQLAREQALGGKKVRANKESISTRDLPRAVHSLPANRHQVYLSEGSLTEDFLSTSSSELFSSDLKSQERSRGGMAGRIYSSALTEQPCPPLSNKEANKNKNVPSLRNDACFTVTPSVATVSPNPKTTVGQSNLLFKKPPIPSGPGKKPVKGFLSQIVHFEENVGRSAQGLQERKTLREPPPPSPVNALASIKEIRRKKLLSNLNKFSFNTSSKKPMLHKVPMHQVENSFVASGRKKIPVKVPQNLIVDKNLKHQEVIRNVTEPRAVQSTFVSSTLEKGGQEAHSASTHTDDMQSIVATIASSDLSGSEIFPLLTEPLNSNLDQMRNSDRCGIVFCNNDVNMLKVAESQSFPENYHQNLTLSTDSYQGKLRDASCASALKINDCAEGRLQNCLSLEDMTLAGYDVRQQLDSPLEANSNHFNSDNSSAAPKKASEESFGIRLSFRESHPRNYLSSSIFIEPTKPDAEDNQLHSRADTFEAARRDQSSKTGGNGFVEVMDVAGCEMQFKSMESKATKTLKIVDYDSSPPSSQENFVSEEDLLESNSMGLMSMSTEKRKSGDNQNQNIKRFCVSGGSPAQSENILSHEVDLGYKMSSLGGGVFSLAAYPETLTLQSPRVNEEQNKTFDIPHNSFEIFPSTKRTFFDTQYEDESHGKVSPHLATESTYLDPQPDDQSSDQVSPISAVNQYKDCEKRVAGIVEQATESVWLKRLDHSGKPFYVHQNSGMTTYLKPSNDKSVQFKFNNRFSFLPKGMSPILNDKLTDERSTSPSITLFHKEEEDLSAIKWDKKQNNQGDFWPLVDQLLAEADEYSANLGDGQVSNATVQELPKYDIKTYNVAFPYTFTKDIFHKLRVLGQLDNKFIVTIAPHTSNKEVIVLFDQHAVHERIRVENLTEAYKQHDGSASWKSSSVEPALPLPLSTVEVRVLESYKKKMEQLGFFFTVCDSSSIDVRRVPTCLLLRENREVTGRGVSVLRQHLENLIREQVDSLLNTRGVGTDHPKIIQNVISSEACRGAVKFGHSLTIADCQAFLHNLSTCNLPFQCAHGRPALVPIADLSMLKGKQPRAKPNLKKLKEMKQTQLHVKF